MKPSSIDLFAGVVPFVATAQARSFREAARQLGVTPSAVSKAISKLEAELGTRLLHRTARAVTLTTEGEAFFARCKDAVEQLQGARDSLSQARSEPQGWLRVSLPLPLGTHVIVPALPRLLSRYPKLAVHVALTDRFVRLEQENVDVVVRIGNVEDSSAVTRRLRGLRWKTVASPEYLARHGHPATPRDLEQHRCLQFVLPNGVPLEWTFSVSGRTERVAVPGTLTSDHGDALVAAAIAGCGIVQAHDFMVDEPLAQGRLVEVLADASAKGPPMAALCAPGRNRSPKVRAFLDFVTELLGA